MPHRTPRALTVPALALVATVGLLAGCGSGSPGAGPAAAPAPSAPASAPAPSAPTAPAETAVPPRSTAGDGAPLGLSVRYVDDNGRFVTVEPQDFPR